jgi:trk system potassium uptake protein TrkH
MIKNFIKIISLLLLIVSGTLIIPITVALIYKEYSCVKAFVIPMIVVVILSSIFLVIFRKTKVNLSIRSNFAITACCWIFSSLLGSIPLFLSGYFPSFTDAFFESVSGFTTTGATILSNVEILPISINVWRCQMHWLGGMGIVALTVALLPLLGVGGFQLIKAETTGPEKSKMTAKITMTAKILWFIYLGLTVVEFVCLLIAGMSVVDAMCYSFSTLGTGGFATKNASIAAYNSVAIEWIICIFMILAGINFSLYFYLLTGKIRDIFRNTEFKAYIGILVTSIILITVFILPQTGNIKDAIRLARFQTAAIMSTSGFATADYEIWLPAAQLVLFFLMFVGGSSGSTSGGVKVVRWVILGKQMHNEAKRMLHPHGVFTIQLNKRVCRKEIVYNVSSFMTPYLILLAITTVIGCIGNLDVLTSFSAAASMVGNVGPAFGSFGPSNNYAMLPDFVKLWYSFAMMAGRLELYTMMIFFMPSYWEK